MCQCVSMAWKLTVLKCDDRVFVSLVSSIYIWFDDVQLNGNRKAKPSNLSYGDETKSWQHNLVNLQSYRFVPPPLPNTMGMAKNPFEWLAFIDIIHPKTIFAHHFHVVCFIWHFECDSLSPFFFFVCLIYYCCVCARLYFCLSVLFNVIRCCFCFCFCLKSLWWLWICQHIVQHVCECVVCVCARLSAFD